MAKYLIRASFTVEGIKGLQKEGAASRKKTVAKMIEGQGGKLEGFYYALGDADAFLIMDVPDTITATAISMAINASGAVKASTTRLITPEEIDEARKKSVGYRAPGG